MRLSDISVTRVELAACTSGVTGTIEKLDEVFPDEGKLDMLQAVNVLKDVGFNGIVQVDHAPQITGDTEYGHMSHAFQIGYLRGFFTEPMRLIEPNRRTVIPG